MKELILCSTMFFQQSSRFWDSVENQGRARDIMLRRKDHAAADTGGRVI